MVDVFPKKLEGEGMDFSHSSVFIGDPKIEYDTGNGIIEYINYKNNTNFLFINTINFAYSED